MFQIQFKEQNKILTKPKNLTDKECGSLPVFNDGEISVSCWKAGWIERIRILVIGRVFLGVWAGKSQPPVKLSTWFNKL